MTTTITEAKKVTEPKKVDPSKFASGWSIRSEDEWFVTIATEHCRIKHPEFCPLCPGLTFEEIDISDLSRTQLAFCNDYSSLEYNHSTQPYAFKWKTLSDGRKVVEDKFGGFDDELIHVKTEDDSFLWNLAKDTRIKKEQPQEVFAYEPDERLTKWGGTVKERKAEKRKPVKRKKGNSVL